MSSHQNSAPKLVSRLELFRRKLHEYDFSAAIISNRPNLYYYTGLRQIHPTHREALLIITPTRLNLLHSAFLSPPYFPHITYSPLIEDSLTQTLAQLKPHANIAIEASDLTVAELNRFQKILPEARFSPTPLPFSESLRIIKDSGELKIIRKASRLTAASMNWALTYLKSHASAKITEKDFKDRLDYKMLELGADGQAFPTIIAFDRNSASPHHVPGQTRLTPRSIVLIDCGAMVSGYCSDMSRTFCLSRPSSKFKEIEKVILSAYQIASQSLLPGKSAASIDSYARSVITKAGFGDKFIHTTGHGLGLDIHESPSLNSHNPDIIEEGMILTIEPGIYLKNQFGYRHENTLLVRKTGSSSLTE